MVQEFVFDEVETKAPKKGSFLWNSETREFLGRDGASWAKITFFYAIFYTCLASFFVGMLAVFVHFMPRDVPTYYGESSTMSSRGLNPGLGFRPQVDVEDHVIVYNPLTVDSPEEGYLKYVRNLKNFLDSKYSAQNQGDVIKCETNQSYVDQLKEGKACAFNARKLFEETDCTEEKSFGYNTNRPCVLVKMNKIIGWEPKTAAGAVQLKCEGETSVDKDNLKKVIYHSEGQLQSMSHGFLSSKYFPYYNQPSYRAPFVWVQFEVQPNVLVNIECKAYADNIDNSDRMNRRGQTKFTLFVGRSSN